MARIAYTVFAHSDCLLHRGTLEAGAFPDVSLSPPPHQGPLPIPCPNDFSASDMVDGRATVKVLGAPTGQTCLGIQRASKPIISGLLMELTSETSRESRPMSCSMMKGGPEAR